MVIGFKDSMKLFLDYDLLASVRPQKPNWFKGADTVSLLAFLEDNLTKEIPGLKDDQIWKYCFFSQMRKPSLPRRTYAVQPTAKVTYYCDDLMTDCDDCDSDDCFIALNQFTHLLQCKCRMNYLTRSP